MIRIFRHHVPKSLLLLGASEAALLFLSVYLGVWIRLSDFNPMEKLLVGGILPKAVLYCFAMMLLMSAMGLYQRQLREGLRGLIFRLSSVFVVGLFGISVTLWLWPALRLGVEEMIVAYAISAAGIIAIRSVVYLSRDGDLFSRRVVVIGTGTLASHVGTLRRKTDRRDMDLLGYFRPAQEGAAAPYAVPEDSVVHAASLSALIEGHDVDELVVAVDRPMQEDLVEDLLTCKMNGVRVLEMVTFLEEQTGKVPLDAISPSRFVFADGFVRAMLRGYLHRALDIGVSAVGLVFAVPLMLITALAIVIESGCSSPVFYRQVRVGRGGVEFEILKFRSMRPDAESGGAQYAARDDDRVTRVGAFIRKLRVDELPQLVNVFRGDMSLVGPRPERPEFVAELKAAIPYYDLRHRVNPGITGWAQINYPYGSSIRDAKEKLQYDLYYIKNYSLFLDVMILVQTAQVVLWGQGAR